MKFSLIICTYNRPNAVITLLNSVEKQSLYPDEILIIDGSTNNDTKDILNKNEFKNFTYFKVSENERGLTKQRNFGISKVSNFIDIVCFLDDDVILNIDYFKELINTYHIKPEALGVGGYITNEVEWKNKTKKIGFDEFEFDGFVRKLGKRNVIRKRVGLLSDKPPGFMPEFSHGFSIGFLPPSNKVYQVDFFIGCSMSFKKEILESLQFSTYFEGYGLYEDLDYCLRVSKKGKLYVNTSAKLEHYHEENGRPNKYEYGKMVVKNGWYTLHIYNPSPSFKNLVKWHSITLVLTFLRSLNVFTTSQKKEAFTESLGRIVGWFSLWFAKKE